jgi:hypothetical protein
MLAVVNGGTAYNADDGTAHILDFNNALDVTREMDESLLNPNQMRCHSVVVDEVPTHLSESSTHSIYIPDFDLRMPLMMSGVISYLPTRFPMDEEIKNCQHIEMTPQLEWDPHSEDFERQEQSVSAQSGSRSVRMMSSGTRPGVRGGIPSPPEAGIAELRSR